jgi:hypothetical protein
MPRKHFTPGTDHQQIARSRSPTSPGEDHAGSLPCPERQRTDLLSLAACGEEDGGMGTEQAHRLKELEKENVRLKKLVADLSLDKAILQETLRGNS